MVGEVEKAELVELGDRMGGQHARTERVCPEHDIEHYLTWALPI